MTPAQQLVKCIGNFPPEADPPSADRSVGLTSDGYNKSRPAAGPKALLINKRYTHGAGFCSGQGVANGGVPERYVPFATPRPRTKTGATQGAPSLLPFRCVPVEGTYASYARFDRALRIRQNRPRGCKVYLLAAPKASPPIPNARVRFMASPCCRL